MKKLLLLAMTSFLSLALQAQWTVIGDSISTNNNVGIGIPNPTHKLHIYPQGPGGILIGHPNRSSGGYTSLSMGVSADKGGEASIQSIQSSGNQWGGLGLNPLGGNVGIGTASPSSKLHVNGNTRFDGLITINRNTWPQAIVQSNGQLVEMGYSSNIFFIKRNDNTGQFRFRRADNYDVMTIDMNNQKVGIGTSTPTAKLHVGGDLKLNAPNNQGILIGKYNDRLGWNGTGNQPGYHIRFAGYRDIAPDFVGARISALRTNICCGGLYQGTELAFYVTHFASPGITGDGNLTEALRIKTSGNVGIGTSNPGSWKLAVNGKIRAKEIKVETGWADFVFDKDYNLPTLKEVEIHIQEKGHLKDIPSAEEVAENGILLGEMNAKLLQKIEELTLYTIQQQKEIEVLKKENSNLHTLSKRLQILEENLNIKE